MCLSSMCLLFPHTVCHMFLLQAWHLGIKHRGDHECLKCNQRYILSVTIAADWPAFILTGVHPIYAHGLFKPLAFKNQNMFTNLPVKNPVRSDQQMKIKLPWNKNLKDRQYWQFHIYICQDLKGNHQQQNCPAHIYPGMWFVTEVIKRRLLSPSPGSNSLLSRKLSNEEDQRDTASLSTKPTFPEK